MLSAFNKNRRSRITASSRTHLDEVYDMKGLNMVAPDQVMPENESPYTTNARAYAREDHESRVAIRSRTGSRLLSTPIGETADTEETGTVVDNLLFDVKTWVTFPWTAGADGALTSFESYIKKNVSGNGPVLIEIYKDKDGQMGQLVGETSLLPIDITNSYDYVAAHLMDAPEVENGEDYHVLYKVQEGGTGNYHLGLVAGSGVRVTTDGGTTWTPMTNAMRFKTKVSTSSKILGFTRRYPQNKQNRTYIGFGGKVYEIDDNGVSTQLAWDLHPSAEYWRTAQVDDKLLGVDGHGKAKWYDGTDVKEMIGVAGNPTHVIIHKNRAFFVPDDDPTRVNFSDLYSFEKYSSTNFFYVPTPKSPDHIAGWRVFQDNLVIFTHETKHTVFGSDISTFTRKEAIGTKGAVSDEAIAVDRNYIYFMADDGQIYRYNGVSDELISRKVELELNSIQDKKKVHMHIYRNQLRIYYAKSPNTIADRMLIFDIESGQWFMDTGRSVVGSLEWYLDDNQLIEFSSRTGTMYMGESGLSDAGKAIDFKYWTAYKIYGSGSAKDRVKRFRPVVRPSSVPYFLNVGKDVDFRNKPDMRQWLVNSGGAIWGDFVWKDGTVWGGGSQLVDNTSPMSGRGKHTQYRFEKKAVGISVEIYGYIGLIKSGRPR